MKLKLINSYKWNNNQDKETNKEKFYFKAFLEGIAYLKKIEPIQMSYIFDMIKNEFDNRAELRRQAENNRQNNPQIFPNKWCLKYFK